MTDDLKSEGGKSAKVPPGRTKKGTGETDRRVGLQSPATQDGVELFAFRTTRWQCFSVLHFAHVCIKDYYLHGNISQSFHILISFFYPAKEQHIARQVKE